MTTYYAAPAPTGLVGNNGLTSGAPKTLKGASDAANPGDTVRCLGGTYLLSTQFQPTRAGTAGNYITYQNHDSTEVLMKWNNVNHQPMWLMDPRSYLKVIGLSFDGSMGGVIYAKSAMSFRFSHHIQAIGNKVYNMGAAGIGAHQCDYLTFNHNLVHHFGYNEGWSSGINLHQCLRIDTAPGFHNVAIGNIVSGGFDGSGKNTDGNGMITDLTGENPTYDPVDANTEAMLLANNVIFHNGGRGIFAFITTNIWMVNNTVVYNGLDPNISSSRAGQIGERGGADLFFINNISYSWGDQFAYEKLGENANGGFFKYYENIWFGGKTPNFTDPEVTNVDPKFVNLGALQAGGMPKDYGYTEALAPWLLGNALHLKPESPARGVGIDPTTLSTSLPGVNATILAQLETWCRTDINGVTRPTGSGWDLGAYHLLTGGNLAPVAVANSYSVIQNTELTVPPPGVLVNDTDPNGDALTAALNVDVAHGELCLYVDGALIYTPSPGYTGPDSFTYHAYDGSLNSNIVTVSLTVVPFAAPLANADAYTLSQNTTLTVAAPGVLINDSTTGGTLTAILNATVAHGVLTLNSNGGFVYTPTIGYSGFDSFTYHAYNGTANSSVVTVSLTISPITGLPIALPDSYSMTQGTGILTVPALTGVLANDSDPASLPLTAVLNSTTSHGTLVLASNGSFTYLPVSTYIGADSFTYHANDGPRNSGVVTVTIQVEAAPAPPTPTGTGPLARSLAFGTYAGRRLPAPSTLVSSIATTSLVLAGNAAFSGSVTLVANAELILAGRARFSARGKAGSVTPKT